MKTLNLKLLGIIVILSLFLVVGCSSNKPEMNSAENSGSGEQSELDELFGESTNDQAVSENPDEDEVLELLGIKKEQQSEQSGIGETTAVGENEDQLRKEINDLERRLAAKDSEIASLRTDISSKDDKIQQLEDDFTKPSAYSQSTTSTSLTGSFKEDYQTALNNYYNRKYKTAIQMFEQLLSRDSNNSLSDNCRYWIGESYYGLGDYNQAIIEFTKVFSFNNPDKADDSQLKLGLCYWRLGDRERARQELERLIGDYPKSEYVDKAQQFLSRL